MAAFGGPDIVTDGLILALDAANPLSYPGTGTTLYDLSGNNYNFTLQGNAAYSAEGKGSIYLDGSADGIQLTSNSALQSSVTLVQWLKTSDTTGLMLSGEPVGSAGSYYVGAYYPNQGFYNGSAGSPSFTINTLSTANPATPINYLDNNWHMWEAKGLNFASWTTTWNFLGYAGGYEIAGYVGVILMYNRSLTAAESLQNYQVLKVRYGV
jgi:hypothetical protein